MRPMIVVAGAIPAMALPAIAEEKAPPPKHDPLSGADARLTAKELRGVGIGRQWVNLPAARLSCGDVVFLRLFVCGHLTHN